VFPDEILLKWMEFLPIDALTNFQKTCLRLRYIVKDVLGNPTGHFLRLKKDFVLTRLGSPKLWNRRCWRKIELLAKMYRLEFGSFNLTGFDFLTFLTEHTDHFVVRTKKNTSVFNVALFGPPDKYFFHEYGSPSSTYEGMMPTEAFFCDSFFLGFLVGNVAFLV
jgi:hypothetical protein